MKPADNQFNSALKSRVQTSRKRQHQSAERRDERLQLQKISDGEEADGGEKQLNTLNHCKKSGFSLVLLQHMQFSF